VLGVEHARIPAAGGGEPGLVFDSCGIAAAGTQDRCAAQERGGRRSTDYCDDGATVALAGITRAQL